MKRKFEIEWPDELGQMWMNVDSLMTCLTSEGHIGPEVKIGVMDVAEEFCPPKPLEPEPF